MGVKLPVLYVCDGCDGRTRTLEVEPRGADETDVVVWFRSVTQLVGLDHTLRALPGCKATHLKDLRFPLSKREGARVGEWNEEDAADYAKNPLPPKAP